MTVNLSKYSEFLDHVARELDIPPSKFNDAVNRYKAVGTWLDAGVYAGYSGDLAIYPQGSFRLGTVVRPLRNGVEAEYDIDLVCEIPLNKNFIEPRRVKQSVGDRLKENRRYEKLLKSEGKRCWTLEYSEEEDGVGFHLDVLPAIPDSELNGNTDIAITDRDGGLYTWSASNPKGYGAWFDEKNATAFSRVQEYQRAVIFRQASAVYASIDEVPNELVRTPLQRSIQLLKRYRDSYFNNPERTKYAPISIIITTLAAHFYRGEEDIYTALTNIVRQLQGHTDLVEGKRIAVSLTDLGLIRRQPDGTWYIGNPVNPEENFADRWHEDNHARARMFFDWVSSINVDLLDFPHQANTSNANSHFSRILGASAVTAHLGILGSRDEVRPQRRKVQIASPAKPWRPN